MVRRLEKSEAPMSQIEVRPKNTLPKSDTGWLSLHDHFVATVGASAGQGQPFGEVLVLADATFSPHSRFPQHPHREMEILSVVVEGELSHHGSQAHESRLGSHEVQLISARDGMTHAEGNESDHPTRMLQIWFKPSVAGGAPAYFKDAFSQTLEGRWQQIAGHDDVPLRADAKVFWINLAEEQIADKEIAMHKRAYLLLLEGTLNANAQTMTSGEGAFLHGGVLRLMSKGKAKALLIEIPTP